MSSQLIQMDMLVSGADTNVPLYSESGARVQRGLDANGAWPRPSEFTCEINNDSLNYDPDRPQSTLYGLIGRSTRSKICFGGQARLWAEASVYEPERTVEHVSGANKGRSSVRFKAEGVLGRLVLWSEQLQSPMRRTISLIGNIIGHWPLEEESKATTLTNVDTGRGAVPGSFLGDLSLGDSNKPDGAARSIKVGQTSRLSGRFRTASSTAGWQISWSHRAPAMPPSATFVEIIRWTTSNNYTWIVSANNTTYALTVTDSVGTLLMSNSVLYNGRLPTTWTYLQVKGSVSGGTVTAEIDWYAQNDTLVWFQAWTFAGTVGALRNWTQNGNASISGWYFSHVFGVTTTSDVLNSLTAVTVFNGYRGETADNRAGRLLGEAGIGWYRIGTAGAALPMGPQSTDTLIDQLRECVSTDDLRIDDERFDQSAVTLRLRTAMYGQASVLTLAWATQVKPPFKKVIGNTGISNRVTAKQRDGGDETESVTSGTMSVSPPPAGIGEIRTSVDVNLAAESRLEDVASYYLGKRSLQRPRYDRVSVDLLANPGLTASVNAVREGDRITVTGYEPDPIDLMVVGIVDEVTLVERTVTFMTEPYEPYQVDLWDATTARYDSRTSTLAAGATSVAGTLSLTTVDQNDVWSTTPGYQLMVGGERVTVTAMTAAIGSGPYTQTATVTRSVNGVVKAQLINTPVVLADPKRWGL